MEKWTEDVLESNKTLFLCLSLYKYIFYDRVRKQFLTILEFEFLDIILFQISISIDNFHLQ